MEHVDEVEKLLKEREDDLEKLIAISHVKRAAENGVTKAALVDMAEAIDQDIGKFRDLLEVRPGERHPGPVLATAAAC